jgi:hypothetical protein
MWCFSFIPNRVIPLLTLFGIKLKHIIKRGGITLLGIKLKHNIKRRGITLV